jgi:hypothetical protein
MVILFYLWIYLSIHIKNANNIPWFELYFWHGWQPSHFDRQSVNQLRSMGKPRWCDNEVSQTWAHYLPAAVNIMEIIQGKELEADENCLFYNSEHLRSCLKKIRLVLKKVGHLDRSIVLLQSPTDPLSVRGPTNTASTGISQMCYKQTVYISTSW